MHATAITETQHMDEEHESGELITTEQMIRDKILHVLKIYPRLSPSMLQVGLGTALSSSIWKPVLRQLIADGEVLETNQRAETPTGRQQVYTVLSLAEQSK